MIRLASIFALIMMSSAFPQLKEADYCMIPAGNCTGGEDDSECYDYNYCIEEYEVLESYIRQNDEVLVNLTKGFFTTGQDPAGFVKITYHYQVPKHNETDEDNSTCSAERSVYFWSTSPSFMLGPKPMFWLSLFAINPVESSVTLQLPCLQENIKEVLLSRLTYLVR